MHSATIGAFSKQCHWAKKRLLAALRRSEKKQAWMRRATMHLWLNSRSKSYSSNGDDYGVVAGPVRGYHSKSEGEAHCRADRKVHRICSRCSHRLVLDDDLKPQQPREAN